MEEIIRKTNRDQVKYVFTPLREGLYKISEALNAVNIPHELHVRPGYATIWAHPDDHAKVEEIARRIDQELIGEWENKELIEAKALPAQIAEETVMSPPVSRAVVSKEHTVLLRVLQKLRSEVNYENASFSDFEIAGTERQPGIRIHFPCDTRLCDQATDAVKETTSLYRDSYINPLIDGLIEWAKGETDIREVEKLL